MEKPSLEIGNGNWAIKENSLLGHTTVDGMILPDPVTVTRATLATRVNPSGLIENVELPGSNIWDGANGDTTGWTNFANNTHATVDGALKITYVDDASGVYIYLRDANQLSTDLTVGKTYKINFDSKVESGQVEWKVQVSGGVAYLAPKINSTTYVNVTLYIVASSTNGHYFFPKQYDSAASVFIKNIKVQEVTRDGLAKIDYTDGTASLLVEPARTNLIPYSEDFTQWTLGTNTEFVSSNNLSPTGVLDAYKYKSITATGNTFVMKNIGPSTISDNTTYTWSIHLRSDNPSSITTGTLCQLNMTGGGQNASINVSELTTEWKRFSVTATSGVSSTAQCFLATDWDVGAEIEFWGAQLEEASYPTSYIKTQGLAVTRAQDKIEKSNISDKIGQTEGTFFLELSKYILNTPNYLLISLNNAASNSDANSVAIGFDNGNDDFYIRVRAGGQSTFVQSNLAAIDNSFYKVAIVYKSGASKIYINGNSVGVNSGSLSGTFTFATVLDNLSFDYNGNNGLPFEGNVRQLQVYKTALTDLEIESLTSFASFTEMANTLNYTIY